MAEEDIMQFQSIQGQLHTFLLQKQQIQAQIVELENAVDEVKKSDEGDIFHIVGNIIIKKEKDELVKSLSEKKESIDLRLLTIDKQVEILSNKAKELQQKMSKESKD